jgi:hypothetical protein
MKNKGNRAGLSVVLRCVLFVAGMMLLLHSAAAATITTLENAQLTTGSLAGTRFVFSFSYDNSVIAGTGQEFIPLTAFDFTLGGATYTFADHTQGGQAIFQNGALENITAFFPAKASSPVFSIAFGFGGPGIIGYRDLNFDLGQGSYAPVKIPEPSSLWSLGLGLALLSVWIRRWGCGCGSRFGQLGFATETKHQ